MRALLTSFSWQELRHHPWRSAAAVLAVTLGVALAFAVHLINASALDEFAGAVRAASGQADLELRAGSGGFDEALYARVAGHPDVALAAPVLDMASALRRPEAGSGVAPAAGRVPLRVLGIDSLAVARLAPALLPRPEPGSGRLSLFAPATVFLNPAARQLAGGARTLQVQAAGRWQTVQVAGTVAMGGPALAVMDIGAAQDLFEEVGRLSRVDLVLRPGADVAAVRTALDLPAGVQADAPGDAAERLGALSRAYRVNLSVLALVALFTGAFLVFSVMALSVARRAPQLALLAVLGLTPRQRLGLVLAESLLLGAAGSLAGLLLGTGLAALALRVLGGDLGGGFFSGAAPALRWSPSAAAVYGALGLAAAVAGGWWPARAAQALPPARTLKGLGEAGPAPRRHRASIALLVLAGGLALLPPIAGLPLAAYASVALLLVGGITALPALVALAGNHLAPRVAHRPLGLLAVERARRVRESAAVAVGGVVAALSLSVALTVMVASFREAVTRWLDTVLPADLYVRTATGAASADTAFLPEALPDQVATLPGVARVQVQRLRSLTLDPARPAVTLIAREIGDPARDLPLVGDPLPVPAGRTPVWVSEAVVDLHGVRPGGDFPALSRLFAALPRTGRSFDASFFIAGVWRDYARQGGAIVLDRAAWVALSGDTRVNDLALWLRPGAAPGPVQSALQRWADEGLAPGAAVPLEFATAGDIRAVSLRIFDRSFAVTYWLQAVAVGIGLFGVAASFSAQVLARRREFGLLVHLGLTRRQVLAVVAGEGATWTALGALAGLGLGLAVGGVLVYVVNPQSFHWTMELAAPWGRLALLCLSVVAVGTLTVWLAGRAAASGDMVRAVREDW